MSVRVFASVWLLGVLAAGACGPSQTAPSLGASACEARPPPAAGAPSLLADPSFAAPPWDSGDLAGVCLAAAPWGGAAWGVEAASFLDADGESDTDRSIDRARLVLADGTALLSAEDASGHWSFARFIQGDVWGGSSCGPVSWNRFAPIAVSDRDLRLDFDVCMVDSELDSIVGSWILVGANVWATAPALPKPLVLDLMVHHRTSMLGTRDGSHENDLAYHYQVTVAAARPTGWTHVSIDLSRALRAATERFGLRRAWSDLAIHQVELVAEVHHARAAARVDNVTLQSR